MYPAVSFPHAADSEVQEQVGVCLACRKETLKLEKSVHMMLRGIPMKILVLAGGFDQIALINKLKSRGHEVLLADYYEDPPAKEYADRHFQISTLDEAAVINVSQKEQVDLVTTACTDQALLTAARVSERLELPFYIDSVTAKHVTDKAYMKQIFRAHGIPTAAFKLVDKTAGMICCTDGELDFPVIVKPCDCNSSKGVAKAENAVSLEQAVNSALSWSRSRKAVIESFLEGDELSVDVWIDRESVKILSISLTEKLGEPGTEFTIFRSSYPVNLSDTQRIRIQNAAEQIASAFHLQNCPMLMQAIMNGDTIHIIEFSVRMGGGTKYRLIKHASGIDIMDVYVNRILGNTEQIIQPEQSRKHWEIDYVYAHNGMYSQLVGFEELLENGVICELYPYKKRGITITARATSSDRILGFLIQGDSCQEIASLRKKIIETVDIRDSDGTSIMYKKCFM